MRPDGDTVGSALALSKALNKIGVATTMCVESDMPSNLKHIDGVELVQKTVPTTCDTVVCVDCSDEQRLGILQDDYFKLAVKNPTVNVDHHVSNTYFAKFNYVRECSANCMNIYYLIKEMGVELDKEIATYLMLGILTDSGSFSHDDVTDEVFTIASDLVKNGASVKDLNENLFKRQSKARAEFYADAMSKIRYSLDDRFAIVVLTQANMEKYGADNGMTDGFVDFPLTVDSVEVSVAIMEVKQNQYKVSLRSKRYADVNKIAGNYGGGGHVRAAGCMLFGELEEVIDKLTYTVSQYLE